MNDESLINLLRDNLDKHRFVRLCNASPKDLGSTLDCESEEEILELLQKSRRTGHLFGTNHICFFMREEIDMEYELRCFFHKNKLRAVGCVTYMDEDNMYIIKNKILKFFEEYTDIVSSIYNSVTIDICADINPFVIECNQFGCGGIAGGELYRWNEDFHILHNSDKPVFRFLSTSGKMIEMN